MGRLNNMLLKKDWAIEEVKDEVKRYIETNENSNTTYQNFWDTVKVAITKFTPLQAYLKEQEISQVYNLTLHLKELEEEE